MPPTPFRSQRTIGFTLVELLVTIAIIGIVLALIVLAVQGAREAARKVRCGNNLRQIGLAAHLHHDAHQHLPTNGWGHAWVGDPDRGFDRAQPGGWPYNLLPFMEQPALREIGRGEVSQMKRSSLARLLQSPIGVFMCPSRRSPSVYPYLGKVPLRNVDIPGAAAKTDYAANAGDRPVSTGPGPASVSASDIRQYKWPDAAMINGVCYVRSEIRLRDIADGTSQVYLIGEKYVSRDAYRAGGHGGDDQTLFVGDDADIRRWTSDVPLNDAAREANKEVFGSVHSGVWPVAFCDGSVRWIATGIDHNVHRTLGNRHDGASAELP